MGWFGCFGRWGWKERRRGREDERREEGEAGGGEVAKEKWAVGVGVGEEKRCEG